MRASTVQRAMAPALLLTVAVSLVLGACLLIGSAGGCTRRPKVKDQGLAVVVSILPQKHFVEKVGGKHVSVEVLVGPHDNPETYQILPQQLTALGRSRIWFTIGMAFEQQLEPRIRSNYPKLKLVPTDQNAPKREMPAELDPPVATAMPDDRAAADNHEGQEDDGHGHGLHDPHIWLDPRLVKIQAEAIAQALVEADPENSDEYRSNLKAFHAELDALHGELREKLAPVAGRRIVAAHPAFGYFTDAYGLRQVSAEVEGKDPTARQLQDLQSLARQHNIDTLFVQPQFSQRTARVVADRMNARLVVLDPLDEDYATNMRHMARQVLLALAPEHAHPEPSAPQAEEGSD